MFLNSPIFYFIIFTGVASPPSHPPLPKKPSLAPKPKVLAVTSQHNTLIEGESIESICSSSSSDAITNDSSHVTQEIQVQASTPETSKSTGNPSRPTPKPRKTINLNANGTPSEVAPSPRPRVLPKRNAPQRESEQSTPAEESSVSSSSTFLNGNEKDVTNSSPPNTQERPNTPVRRLTLGSSDFTPKVSPRNPKWSPVRGPLQRSNSSTSDYSASSSTILDVDVDTKSDNLTPDTKANGQNISLTDTLIKTENKDEDASSSVPTHRPKPNVSPKKPSLALLSKRKTMSSIGHISLDKDNEKLLSENGKKAVPQRPSLPPKRLSAIPIQNGSSSQLTGKSKSHAQELPKEDPPQSNGNKTQELSEDVSSSSESTNNNSPATKESAEQNSTVKSTKCESTSATISGTNISKPAEDSKAPPILPRKAILRNPVAPPRRVKSMSESDPNSELSTDMKRNGGFNNERSCQQKSLESQTKLQSEGEEKTEDNSNTERSTLKRNRRAVKSCDPLAFENVKPFKDKPNVPNGEVQQKSKPPRPPPPSKPSGLIHQTSLQGPPPRPKPIRAKTIDVTSQVNENFKSTSNKTHNQNSPLRSKKIHQVTYEKFDCSDWEIVDITPQQKQKIDEKGREKIISSEFFEDVAAQKSKSDAEIEPELKQSSSKKSNDEQLQQPKQLSKGEETILTKVSETENQPEGEAVSQLKLRKARPPVPAQRNSIEGSPVHKPSSTSVLEEKDVSFNDGNSQEINGRPLSQGSPINGRSPNSSPKKMLKDRGRGSSPRRPSCPPPPPPGVPQPNVATPRAQSPSPKITPAQPKSPTPSELSPAIKPKRPAPPRPNAPPVKMSPNSRSNSPKPALPQNNDAEEDQTNIYSEANVNFQNRDDDDEDSETSSRDHDYELIPDPRRTLTRNSEPTSCSDGETRKDSSSRASGYIDDGLYLEPNQREDEELNDNEYVYPEFMPANNIPISPPTPPPNPELDPVFTQEHPPVVPKNRLSSGARRKAPQKPKRSPSVQSDASFDSHSYYDMTGGMEHIER
nr:serine/arginine repetitive matrix protein 1-like [Lytechinus pictus]